MKNTAIIFLFTVAITLFYCYVGQLVPQKEVPAPETVEVKSDLSTAEMVKVGKKIVDQKCMSCHAIQPRFPAFSGVGAAAASRREGYSDIEYLAEALYEPDAFIVEGFAAGMTPANKAPLNLTDSEILTVIAYLQSLGGTPSVTMSTELKYQSAEGAQPVTAPAADEGDADKGPQSAKDIFANYGCAACHTVDAPTPGVGPSLYDIGQRMSKGELYEALMDPDAVIAEGFAPGMMGAMLGGNGFYTQVSSNELKGLVDYLSELTGEAK